MGTRFIAAITVAAALSLVSQPSLFAQQRGQQAAPQRPARMDGKPNLNGIWQAINTAYWNLEAHSAQPLNDFWRMGAIAAIPAGRSVITGDGKIPYLPDALKKRDENRSKWPASDPEAKCFMLGIPRATYQNMPFQIFQGMADADLLMVYPFAAMNRVIYMKDKSELPVDSWMGKSTGAWEGDTLVVTTQYQNGQSWLDRAGNFSSNMLKVTERFTVMDQSHIRYQATLDDPLTYSRPWTIEMPLYRVVEDNAQLLEHKCVPFADNLLYQDLLNPKP